MIYILVYFYILYIKNYKIFIKIIEGKITIPKNLTILPTSVEELSNYLVEKYILKECFSSTSQLNEIKLKT